MSDELADRLRGEGRSADRGQFTLDERKARRKLQKFQLRDPHEYVLQFVEVAHLLEATWIDVEIDADEVEVRFDGVPLQAEDLESIYASAFRRGEGRRTRAVRHLAIGLMAAREVDPAIVVVESVPEKVEEGAALVVDGDGERVERREGPSDATTRIYLRETLRAAHVPQFFHKFEGELTEQKLVRERCRLAPIPVRLDGTRVDTETLLDKQTHGDVRFDSADGSGVLGLRPPGVVVLQDRRGVAVADLVQNGVLVTRIQFDADLAPARALAVVRTERLKKNLSQSGFVEDDAFRRLTEDLLPGVATEAAIVYVHEMTAGELRDNNRWLERLFWTLHAKLAGTPDPAEFKLLTLLADLPILPLAVPARDVDETLHVEGVPQVAPRVLAEAEGPVEYATRRFPYSDYRDGPVLLARSERSHSAFESGLEILFGGARDVTGVLDKRQGRRENRANWSERPPYSWPDQVDYPWADGAREGELDCQVYLREADGPHEFHVVKQGRLLEARTIDDPPLPQGISAIAGDLEPTDGWEAAARNEPFRRAVYRLTTLIPGELGGAIREFANLRNRVPDWGLRAIRCLAEGTFARRLFDAVGVAARGGVDEFREWYRASGPGGLRDSPWLLGSDEASTTRPLERARMLGELAEIEIFQSLEPDRLSIREVAELCADEGSVAVVVEADKEGWWDESSSRSGIANFVRKYDQGGWERTVLVVDPDERSILEAVAGDAIEEVGEEFRHRAFVDALMRRRSAVEFSADSYAATDRIEGERWGAQLGYRPPHVAPASGRAESELDGELRIDLTFRDRRITTRPESFEAGSARAVVESTAWELDPMLGGIEREQFYETVLEEVRRGVRELVVQYCRGIVEGIEEDVPEGLDAVWRVLAATPDEGPYRELRSLGAFPTAGGEVLSLRQVRGRLGETGVVGYVLAGRRLVAAEARPTCDLVVRVPAAGGARDALERLFGAADVVDVSGRPAEREGRTQFEERPRYELTMEASRFEQPARDPVARGRVGPEAIDGRMVLLSPDPEGLRGRLRYTVLHEGRRLVSRDRSVPVGRADTVVEPEFVRPAATYDRIAEGRERLERRLELAMRRGMLHVARRVERAPAEADPEELRAVLRWLARMSDPERLPEPWRELRERMRALTLFETGSGERLEADRLVRRAEESGGRVSVVTADDRGREARDAPEGTSVVAPSGFGAEAFARAIRRALDVPEVVVDESLQIQTAGRVDRERRRVLEEALRSELEVLDLSDGGFGEPVREVRIEHLPGGWVEVSSDGALRIDPEHVAVRHALESVEAQSPDPVAVALVVSAVWTAANDGADAARSTETAEFHLRHAGRVAEQLQSSRDASEQP